MEEVAGHDDDGRVVDVAQEVDELCAPDERSTSVVGESERSLTT